MSRVAKDSQPALVGTLFLALIVGLWLRPQASAQDKPAGPPSPLPVRPDAGAKPPEPAPSPTPTTPSEKPVEPAPSLSPTQAPTNPTPSPAPTGSPSPAIPTKIDRSQPVGGEPVPQPVGAESEQKGDHRGRIEISPYIGWDLIEHGLGTEPGGEPLVGARLAFNFGREDAMAIDLDWHFEQPKVVRHAGVFTFRVRQVINFGNLDFTYRPRFLRWGDLTPYVSAGIGFAVFAEIVKTQPNDRNPLVDNGPFVPPARVHQLPTLAPGANVAVGLDYRLFLNWFLRVEGRDEVLFTSYNEAGHVTPAINSFTATIGLICAIDW